MKKRFLAISISIAMLVICFVPATALAADPVTINLSAPPAVDGTGYTVAGSAITLTGGDYVLTGSTATCYIIAAGNANVTLNNASIDATSAEQCAFYINNGVTVNMTLTGASTLTSGGGYAGIDVTLGRTLNITAASTGSLTATGGEYAAGIGGGSGSDSGTIIISDGAVTAIGVGGAGIGGGNGGDGGSISIFGGTITADGGIGSGTDGDGGSISISGGTVTANGGYKCAGIGGSRDGGNITISGGTVTTTGGFRGAGIGGGQSGAGGTITIEGGHITANGDFNSAGIGGGEYGAGGTITIEGGDITATGGYFGAGIGGGISGAGGTITIEGGHVYADGGDMFFMMKDIGSSSGGTLTISGTAAVFLRNNSCLTPTTSHTHIEFTLDTDEAYGIAVPTAWEPTFGAYLSLRTLDFDTNGGSGTAPASVTQAVGTTVTVSDDSTISRTNYTFSSWNTAANVSGTAYAAGSTFTFTADTTLYAQWTAHPELTSSVTSGTIYVGGRITLTPNLGGGTWDWDEDFFTATFNSPATFTALKAGTSTITYTVEGVSTTYDVTIKESGLPSTGQDFTWMWVYLLAAFAVMALGGLAAALTVPKIRRKVCF